MDSNKIYNLYMAAVLVKVNNKIYMTFHVHKTIMYNIIKILLEYQNVVHN